MLRVIFCRIGKDTWLLGALQGLPWVAVGWRRQPLEIVRRLARNDGRDRVDNITSKERATGNSRPYTLDRLARVSVKMSTLDRPLIDGKKGQRRRPDPAGLHPHPAF